MAKKQAKVSKPYKDVFRALGVKRPARKWKAWALVCEPNIRSNLLFETRSDARSCAAGRSVIRVEVREIKR